MTRVTSQQTRQALLVVGSSMEVSPPPEVLELFLPDGTAVDVGKDRTRARWRGTWGPAPELPYEQNDFVLHDNKLYILADIEEIDPEVAPNIETNTGWVLMTRSAGMLWAGEYEDDTAYAKYSLVTYDDALWILPEDADEENPEPGYEPAPPAVLAINRAVEFTEADRLTSLTPVRLVIGTGPGEENNTNDIGPGISASVLIDVSGAQTGRTLSIKPISHVSGSGTMTASSYYAGNSFDISNHRTWTSEEVDSQTVKTMDISSFDDRFVHIFFDTGAHGEVEVWVNDDTNLVDPPTVDAYVEWEQILEWKTLKQRITVLETADPGGGGGDGAGDPSVILDCNFDSSDWADSFAIDSGGFTWDSSGEFIVPTAAPSRLRALVPDMYNALVAVEIEALSGIPASGYFSLRIRENVAATHGLHANLDANGVLTEYKYHGSSYTSFAAGTNMAEGGSVIQDRRYWIALWSHGRHTGVRGSYFPLGTFKPPPVDLIYNMTGDSNFVPDAAGRVDIIPERTQVRIHRVTVRDLSKSLAG